jgi:protein-disulfide isomerase
VSQVLFEVVGEKGKLIVLEDSEIGHVFAVIPYGKKASPALIRALREQTLDPWRYVEGIGFVLDITAWKSEAALSLEDIKNKIEKYKSFIDQIFQLLESATSKSEEKKKKRKKTSKKTKKSGKKTSKKKSSK